MYDALCTLHFAFHKYAGVAELADALDLGSSVNRCAGSSPVARTISSVHNQPESWMWTLDFFLPTFCIFLYV